MTASAMRTAKHSTRICLLLVLGLMGGCLYRMPIQQGNVLNPDQVAQLEPGMTRSQVMFLLGTPMVPNGFNTDRWDYYFYVKDQRGDASQTRRLTVWFKDDKVDHFDGNAAPKPGKPATQAAG
jgi:outer membrane protein assembly factor BamE (lipoprotein component of BamABCDE complex)